ncbi:hypothetical protein HELRODRAFT_164221 [Helobdella robusta]|uniref:Uncharacterized protein n=1 Tax=Helobdella robusta TaxID=6412 RepID=T1EV42_HELRO|nr:hypothetical protein HELRODRAFT_164221 [Helobdella robusta]ESN94388.1 hypothetical protein HELRODRAFT_164221 [Helobdella robusta]
MSREVASEPLRRVTHFILNFYGPSWFKIKSNSSCRNGANNFFYLVQLFRELDALDQAVVRPVLKNNCYFAHAENILLAAFSDSDMEICRFSVEQIIRAREKQTNSNIPVRVFDKKDITLNLAATSFINMIDWDQRNVTSPPMLSHLSNDQLTYTHPILLPDVPCHSQAVERTIKDVSAASCKVYGRKSRHGMVLQSKKSRLEIPIIDSKKDFINS